MPNPDSGRSSELSRLYDSEYGRGQSVDTKKPVLMEEAYIFCWVDSYSLDMQYNNTLAVGPI